MASELTHGDDVLARSLADWDAYWSPLGPLTKAQRRWRNFERQLRINGSAQAGSVVPDANDSIIAEIRSGEWEKRQRTIGRNMLRDRAKVAMWKRDGYTLDAEHRLVAPERRESGSRPRERRSRRRHATARRTRAGASRDGPSSDDPDPEPEPVAFVRGFTAASERLSRHLQRRDGARRFA